MISGVNLPGQFFGDAHLMTGVFLPTLEADNQSADTANAAAIQAAIDSSEPGATIRLPNGKFYCDQINIPANKPGLTIEGGGRTLIINKTGTFPTNYVVFYGFADRIADAVGMHDYQPGAAMNSFTAYFIGGGSPIHFTANDVM